MQTGSSPCRQPRPGNAFVEFRREEVEQSIPDRFEQQARAHPRQIAIKSKQHELTYRALNQDANRLARAILANWGKRPEHVGILMGNDAPGIAAIFGVLKAGKSYVPFDPLFPRERLAYSLEDSQAHLIVTGGQHEPLARELSRDGGAVVNVDEIDPGLSGEDLELAISPYSLAQLNYTSGSSGRPKGVAHNHRDFLHNTMNLTNSFHLSANDRVTMLHPLGSISSAIDFCGALLNGATLFPWDFKQEGFVGLARWLVEEEITVWHWIPTPFRAFMRTLTDEVFPSVRLLTMVGEAMSSTDLALYKKHLTRGSLLANKLGSTEAFDFRVFFTDHESKIDSGPVPVGYALDGEEVILLDEDGQEIGFDRIGEIAVRSPYLAQGYWRKPEETRRRFLPDPEGGRERTFLTGDLGMMRPDGCLEYHGRKDFQVKIRGHRVEVSEIELAVVEHPDVREAVVVGREDQTGDTRLVAYVVPQTQTDTEVGELRRLVSERLPDYMMPAAFVTLPALPRTPNGKINRTALPVPDVAVGSACCPPGTTRTPVEDTLVAIWTEVLGVRDIGVNDNFFELGGHSLLALRLFAKVERMFGKRLSTATLFRAPTIEELAEAIRREDQSANLIPPVELQRGGSRPPFFLVHAFGGGVLRYRGLASRLGADQPVYGLQAKGVDGKEEPHRRIEDMAEYCVESVRAVQPQGPYYLGGFCYAGVVAFEMARQLRSRGEQVALVAIIDALAPVGPGARAPLWHPAVAYRFMQNLPVWIYCSVPGRYGQVLQHIRVRLWGNSSVAWRRLVFGPGAPQARFSIEDFLGDTSRLPAGARDVADAHLGAARRYSPGGYPGKIKLFRAPALPLFHPHDRDLGWGRVVSGGVDVEIMPGDHSRLLEEPFVEGVAARLRASIEQAQAAAAP